MLGGTPTGDVPRFVATKTEMTELGRAVAVSS
jgi:hypothetical protein